MNLILAPAPWVLSVDFANGAGMSTSSVNILTCLDDNLEQFEYLSLATNLKVFFFKVSTETFLSALVSLGNSALVEI